MNGTHGNQRLGCERVVSKNKRDSGSGLSLWFVPAFDQNVRDISHKLSSDTGNRTPSCREVIHCGIMRGGNVSRYTISDVSVTDIIHPRPTHT